MIQRHCTSTDTYSSSLRKIIQFLLLHSMVVYPLNAYSGSVIVIWSVAERCHET